MGSDLEKAARRVDELFDENMAMRCDLVHEFTDRHVALRAALPEKPPQPQPEVTREDVEKRLAMECACQWDRDILRSWLALEEGNTYLSVQVERLNEENAKLRAVAEAAEAFVKPRHGTMSDHAEKLRAALRRLKWGE